MKYSRAIKNFGYKEGVDYPHRSLLVYANENSFLSAIKRAWKDTAPLDRILQDKRFFITKAEKCKSRPARAYFLGLAEDNSMFIRRNAGWWRKFDRALAARNYDRAMRIIEVLFGRYKLLQYRNVNYRLDMEVQHIPADEHTPHFNSLPVHFHH